MRNRVSLSIAVGAGLLAAGTLPAQDATAADKVVWNISLWGNPRAVTAGIEAVKDELMEKTDGNFELRLHYGEAISPAKENLDSVKIMSSEGALVCQSYAPGKTPVMTVLDLPFLPGLGGVEGTRHVHEAFFENPHAIAELEGWNAKPYLSTVMPLYEFMGAGDPPETLEGWKGMRVRALGGIGDAMRKLGAVPTTVPAPEVYTALERGVVQAASFGFTYAHGAYKLQEVSNWYTNNMDLGTPGCFYAIGLAAHEALPSEYQQLLTDAKPGAYEAFEEAYRAADDEYLPIFRERNLKSIEYSEEQRDQFVEVAAKPVWNEWVAKIEERGLPGQEILDYVLEVGGDAPQQGDES